jgi:tetratricopeptide (TPR) repeat protein
MRVWTGLAVVAALAMAGPAAASGKTGAAPLTASDEAVCAGYGGAGPEAMLAACGSLLAEPDNGDLRRVGFRVKRAEALLRLHKTDEALAEVNEALKADPDDADALVVRAVIESALRRFDAAQADLDRAVTLAPTSSRALRYQGEMALYQLRYDLALADFEKLVQLYPDWFYGYFGRGRARQGLGDMPAAVADLDSAVALAPDAPAVAALVLSGRAELKVQMKDLAGARADADQAVAVSPKDARALAVRGRVRFLQGDYEAGLADISAAIAMIPDNPGLLGLRASLRLSQTQDGQFPKADLEAVLADLQAVVALQPSDSNSRASLAFVLGLMDRLPEALVQADLAVAAAGAGADVHAIRANLLARLDRMAEARAEYDKALAILPSGGLWSSRAETWGPGENIQRLADLDRALALSPDLHYARLARISVLVTLKRLDEAQTEVGKVLAEDDTDQNAYYWRARIHEARGQYADAVADLTQAMEGAEQTAALYNMRCWVRAEWGQQLNEALADCDTALKLSPGSFNYLDSRGLAHLRLGQYDLAIADYDAALAKMPDMPTSLYGRGLARLRKGLTAEGQTDLAAARAKSPTVADQFAGWGLKP